MDVATTKNEQRLGKGFESVRPSPCQPNNSIEADAFQAEAVGEVARPHAKAHRTGKPHPPVHAYAHADAEFAQSPLPAKMRRHTCASSSNPVQVKRGGEVNEEPLLEEARQKPGTKLAALKRMLRSQAEAKSATKRRQPRRNHTQAMAIITPVSRTQPTRVPCKDEPKAKSESQVPPPPVAHDVQCRRRIRSKRTIPAPFQSKLEAPDGKNAEGRRFQAPRCKHDRVKQFCSDCSPHLLCEHCKYRRNCRICNPEVICTHGKTRRYCLTCRPEKACVHGFHRYSCKTCRFGSILKPGERRFAESDKKPKKCIHGQWKSVCVICGGSAMCEHEVRRNRCLECKKRSAPREPITDKMIVV